MQILKMLTQLEKLETDMARLYEWFSHVFREDEAAAAFFYGVSVEEEVHANIVRYQRRLVSQNIKNFSEVDFDLTPIEKTLSDIAAIRKTETPPSLEEALRYAIELEHGIAEEHYRTILKKANPEVEGLLKSLGAFDLRHLHCFQEFIEKRGGRHVPFPPFQGTAETRKNAGPSGGEREIQAAETDKELLEKIDHLHTWYRSMDYYKFFGIREYATEQQVRHAYSRIAKAYHPDMHFHRPDDIKQKLADIFAYAVDAYTTLSSPQRRQLYNATLRLPRRH
ncbi:MAG: DnaJ domain-containing protein [Thermodesulfovibrionales bacterium]